MALDPVVQRALAKQPDDRQPSAGDLGRAARAAVGGTEAGPARTMARGSAAPELLDGSQTISTARVAAHAGRWRRLAVTGALLALVVAAAAVLTTGGGDADRAALSPTPETARNAEPRRPRVGETVHQVGFRPRGIAVSAGDVWVISAERGRIARIGADSLQPHGTQPRIGRGAVSIAAHGSSVWVAATRQGSVIELDSRTGRVRRRLPIPVAPFLVAADSGGLWVAGHQPGAAPDVLFHFDVAGRLLGKLAVRDDITALEVGGGKVWIAHSGVPRILGYDADLRTRDHAWLEADAKALAYGDGHLWASVADDSVARYDPRSNQTVKSKAASSPAGLAVAGGRVFVASNTDHTVVVIDPETTRPVGEPLTVPPNPWAVTAGAGHVWVSGLGTNTVSRIDY